jgi:phosphate uptake regulator
MISTLESRVTTLEAEIAELSARDVSAMDDKMQHAHTLRLSGLRADADRKRDTLLDEIRRTQVDLVSKFKERILAPAMYTPDLGKYTPDKNDLLYLAAAKISVAWKDLMGAAATNQDRDVSVEHALHEIDLAFSNLKNAGYKTKTLG